MGEARRQRLAASKGRLKLVTGGLAPPPAVAPVRITDLHILVPTEMAGHINDLNNYVGHRFPTRNDFLVELLASGLAVAAQAMREALAEKNKQTYAKAQATIENNPEHEEKKPRVHMTFNDKPEEKTDG